MCCCSEDSSDLLIGLGEPKLFIQKVDVTVVEKLRRHFEAGNTK